MIKCGSPAGGSRFEYAFEAGLVVQREIEICAQQSDG
jgi:hypothetical protein